MLGTVVSVSLSPAHDFSKEPVSEITLLTGLGVQGDAHAGATVRHLYRVRKDPTAPNLCQVHLLHAELFDELARQGIAVRAGEMGENVTTRGIDLMGLPRGTLLHLGRAVVEVTGLREPCAQMNALCPGLMKACLARDAKGALIRKAGIMAIVVEGGMVRPGDDIVARRPEGQPLPLLPV
jgi:MOSC domain-containing protein YiiM